MLTTRGYIKANVLKKIGDHIYVMLYVTYEGAT